MDLHDSSSLQRIITVRTPENIELHYALAGAGSRIAAYAIDLLLMLFLVNVCQNLIMALFLPAFATLSDSGAWAFAIGMLVSFVLFNGYFIIFEWLMNGRTPGKRVVGIRVIKDGGYALRFVDTLIRNLMRAVDFLPLFYGIGLTSLLLTPRSQRLGDLLAGTLLVHQQEVLAETIAPSLPEVSADNQTLPAHQLAAVPDELTNAIARFFQSLSELAPRYRQEIAAELVALIRHTSGLAPERTQSAETFLASLIRQSERTGPWE